MNAGDIPLGRTVRLALLAAALGLGLLSLAIARGEPAYSLGGGSLTAEVAGLLAGCSLIAAGLVAWARRPASRFGPLVVAAGLAWFLAEWNNPGAGVALVFTAGLVLHAACPPLLGHGALAYPGGRLRSRLKRVAVAVAYGGPCSRWGSSLHCSSIPTGRAAANAQTTSSTSTATWRRWRR